MAQNPSSNLTVGCKLPNGLVLQLKTKERVTLNGARTSGIAGGYGMTLVDEAFWTQWVKENPTYGPLTKGIIFAQAKEVNAKAQAIDTRDIRTGLEPITQDVPVSGISQPVRLDPGQGIEKFTPAAAK